MENITEDINYRIERISNDKLKDIDILYEIVYKHKPSKDHFLKKYNTVHTGLQYIGHIAYNDENISVAHFAIVPCFIQYENELILSGQATDAMTHPSYRNKGLLEKLAQQTFEMSKANGIKFLFGFPNQNSYHTLVNKLGWKKINNLQLFSIHIKASQFMSALKKIRTTKFNKNYTQQVLQGYMLSGTDLSNSFIKEGFAGVYRDDIYLKYKRSYSNSYLIKIENAKLWIRINNNLIIGDIEVQEQEFDSVIIQLQKIVKQLGLKQILFQTSAGTKVHALFASRYESKNAFPFIMLNLGSGMAADKLKFSFADIDIF